MSNPKAMYDDREDRVVWRCHAASFDAAMDAADVIPEVPGYRLEEVRVRRRGRGTRVSLSLFFGCTDRRIRQSNPAFWQLKLAPVAIFANDPDADT